MGYWNAMDLRSKFHMDPHFKIEIEVWKVLQLLMIIGVDEL